MLDPGLLALAERTHEHEAGLISFAMQALGQRNSIMLMAADASVLL